jgi:cytochrome b
LSERQIELVATPVWDAFVRLFHWSLVALFTFSVVSAKIGGAWITWHVYSGYAILSLVLFRLMWGFVGGEYARFASFLAGPLRGAKFAASLFKKGTHAVIGHNPVGGWMVIVLLLLLGTQAILGLFSNDEIATSGALARYVSDEASIRAMSWHRRIGDALLILVAIHVAAVLFHVLVKKEGLIRAMFSGKKHLPADLAREADAGRRGSTLLGFALLSLAIATVAVAVNWASIVK